MVAVKDRYFYEPMFSSALLLAFMYTMIILMPEQAKNRHTSGKGGMGVR